MPDPDDSTLASRRDADFLAALDRARAEIRRLRARLASSSSEVHRLRAANALLRSVEREAHRAIEGIGMFEAAIPELAQFVRIYRDWAESMEGEMEKAGG